MKGRSWNGDAKTPKSVVRDLDAETHEFAACDDADDCVAISKLNWVPPNHWQFERAPSQQISLARITAKIEITTALSESVQWWTVDVTTLALYAHVDNVQILDMPTPCVEFWTKQTQQQVTRRSCGTELSWNFKWFWISTRNYFERKHRVQQFVSYFSGSGFKTRWVCRSEGRCMTVIQRFDSKSWTEFPVQTFSIPWCACFILLSQFKLQVSDSSIFLYKISFTGMNSSQNAGKKTWLRSWKVRPVWAVLIANLSPSQRIHVGIPLEVDFCAGFCWNYHVSLESVILWVDQGFQTTVCQCKRAQTNFCILNWKKYLEMGTNIDGRILLDRRHFQCISFVLTHLFWISLFLWIWRKRELLPWNEIIYETQKSSSIGSKNNYPCTGRHWRRLPCSNPRWIASRLRTGHARILFVLIELPSAISQSKFEQVHVAKRWRLNRNAYQLNIESALRVGKLSLSESMFLDVHCISFSFLFRVHSVHFVTQ